MPELANRDEYERLLASRLARVNGQHRRELIELLGDPPDIGRIDAAFWTRASAELQAVIAPILEDVAIAAAEQLIAGLPIGVDWGLVNQQAADWAARYTFDLVRGLNDTSRRALQRALERYFEQGQTIGDLRDALSRIFSPNRAQSIAVTEITRAAAQGELQAAQDIRRQGVDMIAVWQTNRDELVCPICGPLQGAVAENGIFRGDSGIFDSPPAHVNCVLPGNVVYSPGGISAAAKSFYSGEVVEISLGMGRSLTVTPNHPVLTVSGWKTANLINEGDHLVDASGVERVAPTVNPYDQDRPAVIEEVFRALVESPSMVSVRMPSSTKYFHGDGRAVNGDIDVVFPNSFLRGDTVPTFGEPVGQTHIHLGRVGERALFSFGHPAENIGGLLATANSVMSGGSLLPPLFGTHPAPLDGLSFGVAAGIYTGFEQSLPKSPAIDTRLASEFILAFSGFIATQQVVKVRNYDFTGHVYDLQNDRFELYTCNGIITHNCRCWVNHQLPEV